MRNASQNSLYQCYQPSVSFSFSKPSKSFYFQNLSVFRVECGRRRKNQLSKLFSGKIYQSGLQKWAKKDPLILAFLLKYDHSVNSGTEAFLIKMNEQTYHCCTSFSVTVREIKSDISSEEGFGFPRKKAACC